MAAAAAAIPLNIDFGSRVATLRAVAAAINANLTYWGATVTAVPRAVLLDQSAANSPRRYTSQLNGLVNAVGGAYTAFAMSPPSAALKPYLSSDYHDFQTILKLVIAQHNAIVTAHP